MEFVLKKGCRYFWSIKLAAKKRGIDVLLILNYNNLLYAPHAGAVVTTDSNRIAFARYCQEVVKRYAPLGVTHCEIWNEPNIPIFWDPTPNAADYVRLLQTAYPVIKTIDSTVTVIGCATSPAEYNPSPFIDWLTFITAVFQQRGKKATTFKTYLHKIGNFRQHSSNQKSDYISLFYQSI